MIFMWEIDKIETGEIKSFYRNGRSLSEARGNPFRAWEQREGLA
jgi:hypothetical protein